MITSDENSLRLTSAKVAYVASFDGLRGFAVLLVLITHASYGLYPGGFLGVDLFFIVSGYLITSLLWKEYAASSNISLKNFYARRFLRLYPALLLGILLALALWHYSPPGGNALIASFASFFYIANLIDDQVMGNMNPFWSLAVEEHFYFIWPIFIALMAARLGASRTTLFIVALIAAVTMFRIFAGIHQGEWRYGILFIDAYSFTLCRIDCILFGTLLFFLLEQKKLSLVSQHRALDNVLLIASVIFIVGCGFVVSWSDPFWLRGGFLITNAAAVMVVFQALRNAHTPLFNNKLMIWIGKRSYGIYIYHLPIFLALEQFRVPHDNLNFLVISAVRIILSIGVAALSYRFIEQPILRYKRRFQFHGISQPRAA